MKKIQKTAATISLVIVVVLSVLLGIFLWKESRAAKEAISQSQADSGSNSESSLGKQEEKLLSGVEEKTKAGGNSATEEPGEDGNHQITAPGEAENQQTEKGPGKAEDRQGTKELSEEPASPTELTMVFAGDVLFSQYVLDRYEAGGIEGVLSPGLLEEIRGADIAMVNEEFPFSSRGTPEEDKQFTFRSDPSYVRIFNEMGVDLVTVANNHALDFGTEALSDTLAALDGAGISYVGAGETKERAAQPAVMEAGGRKIGFLGASRVIPNIWWNIDNRQPGLFCTYDSTNLKAAVRAAKEQCDYVVVYVHWGIERNTAPEEYQRELAKEYIDAGADLVVGAHPHVLQGIEYYQGKPIVYSLGNFIFNQEIPSTALLKVTLPPSGEAKLKLIPAYAAGAYTEERRDEAAKELFSHIEGISFSVDVDMEGVIRPQ